MSEPLPVPQIRRARGYRLYDQRGRRYLDLWQNGGRSLLGHRPARQTTLLKGVLSKGLAADLPSVYTPRLERALLALLPGYTHARVVASVQAALRLAGAYLGRQVSAAEVADPALAEGREVAEVSLWRPGLEIGGGDSRRAPVLIPVLPFGLGGAPAAVCFAGALPAGFPGSEVVSPFLLAGALRSLCDLQRRVRPEWMGDELLCGLRGWRRRGIYLVPACGEDRYGEVFRAFLEGGVLLSPTFPGPSILPGGELSRGELQAMIGLFGRYPGE
jgi:hypothetical protein